MHYHKSRVIITKIYVKLWHTCYLAKSLYKETILLTVPVSVTEWLCSDLLWISDSLIVEYYSAALWWTSTAKLGGINPPLQAWSVPGNSIPLLQGMVYCTTYSSTCYHVQVRVLITACPDCIQKCATKDQCPLWYHSGYTYSNVVAM